MQLFYIKIQFKKINIDAFIDLSSQVNLISKDLVKNFELETHPYTHPYPLGWASNMKKMQVTHQ